jgi:hypothetical protein
MWRFWQCGGGFFSKKAAFSQIQSPGGDRLFF